MRIVLKNSYNENKVFQCLAGDAIIYDLTTLWAIGRWEGSNSEQLDNVKKIQIPYNNILYIEDEDFQYDDLSIAEEMQRLSRTTLMEHNSVSPAQSPPDPRKSMGEPEVKRMIAEKKKEIEHRINSKITERQMPVDKQPAIQEAKLIHPGRHRHPTSGIMAPEKKQSKLPFLIEQNKKKKDK